MTNQYLITRMRRLRQTPALRSLIQDIKLHPSDFVQPLFIKEGLAQKQEIGSMPGVYQLALDDLEQEIESLQSLRVSSVILFGIPLQKDDTGSCALNDDGIIQKAIRKIKKLNKGATFVT